MPSRTPSVVRAVRRELRALDEIKDGTSTSALAATALAMARELDDRENTASGMASCARVLDSVMAELRLTARRGREQPPDPPATKDELDDLRQRHAARRAGP